MSGGGRTRSHDRVNRALTLLATTLPLAVPRPVHAQTIDLSGYVENTTQLDYTTATNAEAIDAGKLRLDLSGELPLGLGITGNVNLIRTVGAIERRLTPYLPSSVQSTLAEAGVPDTYSLDRTRLFVDNLFLSWQAGPVRVRAGKQQLSWGPGYGFNPTDLFHRKTLIDPTYEKEGVTALRFDYQWGIGGQFTVIGKPREGWSEKLAFVGSASEAASRSGVALRFATHPESLGYDIAFTAHQVVDSTAFDPEMLTPYAQRRRALGMELSGALFGLGVWLEGNVNWMEREPGFARVIAGADYTLDDGTYLMAEALYNGRGQWRTPFPAHDWLANVVFGEPVGSGWLLVGARRDITQLVSGTAYAFVTPEGSVLLNPRLDVSLGENLDAVAFAGVTLGAAEGAFPPGLYSAVLRITYYY